MVAGGVDRVLDGSRAMRDGDRPARGSYAAHNLAAMAAPTELDTAPVRRDDKSSRQVAAAVQRAVRAHDLWQPGQRVLLACSGGADSIAALHVLDRLQPSLGHRLLVGHVDHGLWPGSAAAAVLVATTCAQRGLPFGLRTLRLAPGADLEARARDARYAALHDLAGELRCQRVVTAHHADDQAETLLLRAARGASPDALAAIRRCRDDGAGRAGVVRPFLEVSRAALRTVAAGMPIAEDPSNADPAYSRNALRHQVLPVLEIALPGAAAGLARTAGHLAAQAGVLDVWVNIALSPRSSTAADGALVVDTTDLARDAATLAMILRFAARRLDVALPSGRATTQFLAAMQAGATSCTVKGLAIEATRSRLRFCVIGVARRGVAD